MKGIIRIAAMLTAGITLAIGSVASAQEGYPARPIRFVVPYTPGGTTDLLARILAQKLGETWKQQVFVDNKAGAGGNIGTDIVAKAPGDGYTILMGAISTHAINPALYKKLPYNPATDFAPVTLVGTLPNVIVVNPAFPAKTVRELIAYARANPGKLSFASPGNGTSLHLSGELFNDMAGIDMQHVPYKGSTPALNDVIGGQVALMFDNLPASLPHVKAGRLRALAVTTARRSAAAPDIPTVAESGLPGFEVTSWFAVFAPAATPRDIVAKLNRELVRIINTPEVRDHLAQFGVDAAPTTPEQLAAFVRAEAEKWAPVVKKSGAGID